MFYFETKNEKNLSNFHCTLKRTLKIALLLAHNMYVFEIIERSVLVFFKLQHGKQLIKVSLHKSY